MIGKIDFMPDLARLIQAIGIHATARRLGVHPRTVRRWRNSETLPPGHLWRLIRLETRHARGELDALGPRAAPWSGWRILPDGTLESPTGATYTPGELAALDFLRRNGALR